MFAFRKYAVYNVHVPGKKEHDRVSKISENGGMVIMEFTYMGYRIEKSDDSNEVFVYLKKRKVMHLLLAYSDVPEKEMIYDIKQTMRILDM